MGMQNDSAPPHYALCSRQVMNEIFIERWIGRDGLVAWPPPSLDLTSPDYLPRLMGKPRGRSLET